MAFCTNCGTNIADGNKFCPGCGAPAPTAQTAAQTTAQQTPATNVNTPAFANTADTTALYDNADIEKNKAMAALGYIIFLIPMFAAKDSPFARYHTNQGLVLFLTAIISLLLLIIPIIGWILVPIISLGITVLAVIGIINALSGKAKDLPIIGKFRILK